MTFRWRRPATLTNGSFSGYIVTTPTYSFLTLTNVQPTGFLISPATPQLIAALDYYQSLQTQSGGDVHIGRKFKALLREAGFRHLEFSASYECYRSLESIGEYLAQGMECSLGTATTPSDGQRIQSFATALRDWYRCEDGVFAQCWCEILGRE